VVVPKDTGSASIDPVGQAERAVESLVIVLVLVVGVVFAIKRSGLLKNAPPAQTGQFRTAVVNAAANRFARPGKPLRAPMTAKPHASSPATKDSIRVLRSEALDENTRLHLVCVNGKTLLLGASAQAVGVLAQWDDVPQEPAAATGVADRLQALLDHSRRSDIRQPVVPAGRGEAR
jgi:hypothetical protein